MKAGAVDFLEKPLSSEADLLEAVPRALARHPRGDGAPGEGRAPGARWNG